MLGGCLALAVGAGVTIAAIETGTVAVLLLGTGIAGLGYGPAFTGDFTAAATRTRMLAMRVLEHPEDEAVRAAMYDSLLDARVYYERLRLISTSLDVHEAGRYALRYTTGITLLTEGKQPRKDERDRNQLRTYSAISRPALQRCCNQA